MTNTNYNEIKNEFYTKYKNELVPILKQMDGKRKQRLVIAIICTTICFLIGAFVALLAFVGYMYSDEYINTAAMAGLMFALGVFIWWVIKKNFEHSIKSKIMPSICNLLGDMKWSCNIYMDDDEFQTSCVIPDFSYSSFDDIFTGSWQNTQFDIVESEYVRKYKVGSKRYSHTVFKGVIIKLEMNKKFKSHTVIRPNGLFHYPPKKELRHTQMEDIEFEKKYDVYTNDEIDARYLITTAFMERINNIKVAFKANKVSCAFYKNNLYIALATKKDLFSICSLIKPLYDDKQFFEMYEEIVSIIKLIDYFKLNQHIGL